MLRNCCRSSGLILVALLCAAGAAPAQSPVQDQVPPAEQLPDDAAAQAHALRQIIAAMEVEAAELEPRLQNARQHLADLNRQVEETATRLEEDRAGLAKLREDERQARAAVDEAAAEKGRQQAALEAASSELAQLTRQVEVARVDVAELSEQLDVLGAKEAAQVERLLQLEADVASAELRRDEELPAQQAQLEEQIASLRTDLAELNEQRDDLHVELARSSDLSREIESQEERALALANEVGTLTAELAVLTRVREAALALAEPAPAAESTPEADAAPAVAAADSRAAPTLERSDDTRVGAPRDPALVRANLATAPGLPEEPELRARLRDLLIEGHCTIDALRQVQDPINRQSLLVLVRGLGGC